MYRKEVLTFADWRNKGSFDYSTNAVVTNWYSGCKSKYYRFENIQDFNAQLDSGKILKLGIDYYALFPISGQFFSREFIYLNHNRLLRGEVIRLRVWKANKNICSAEY